jgi:hypothetical protein
MIDWVSSIETHLKSAYPAILGFVALKLAPTFRNTDRGIQAFHLNSEDSLQIGTTVPAFCMYSKLRTAYSRRQSSTVDRPKAYSI